MNDEYSCSGEVKNKEVKYFTYKIKYPPFIYYLLVSIIIINGLLLIGLIGIIIYYSIIENANIKQMTSLLRVFVIFLILFMQLIFYFVGNKIPYIDYVFTINGFKTYIKKLSEKKLIEYNKKDIKKIIHKDDFIGIKINNIYFIIIDRFFENKEKYKEFINFLNIHYNEKIINK
jgi:hypothetical protein